MFGGPSAEGTALVAWGVVIASSALAAAVDARTRRIPNALTGPLALAGLIWSVSVGGLNGLGGALLATVLVAAPFVLLWLIGGSGAGDAKMMGAVGAWLGLANGTVALLAVAIAGGILSILSALARHRMLATLSNLAGLTAAMFYLVRGPGALGERRQMLPQPQSHRVPYGVAIFAGVCSAAAWVMLRGP